MAPKLPCRELTGADCDRPVALDARDCGIAEHVVPPQPEKRAPGRESIPMGVRRPTLVVDEEFDLFDDLDDDLDDGEIPAIDASSLLVSATAQRSFTTRHQVLPEVAIDEIRFLAARAVEMDSIELLDTGRLKLSAKKFVLYLSPNGRTVVGYATRHYERTPTQVFAGQPSRFGAGRSQERRPRGAPLEIEDLRHTVDPSTVRISSLATNQFARVAGLRPKEAETGEVMRQAYVDAFADGSWATGQSGPGYEISHLGRKWVIATDDGSVILCVPLEPGDA